MGIVISLRPLVAESRRFCSSRMADREPTRHLSLHFDGIRVDADRISADGSVEEFCSKSENAIYMNTNFDVTIVQKHHMTFIEHIRQCKSSEPRKLKEYEQMAIA